MNKDETIRGIDALNRVIGNMTIGNAREIAEKKLIELINSL